jgi:nucleoside-diphosphate-sugar epimerase
MKSLVTGSTGFIGSHLAEMLKAEGHDVRLLVRNEKRLFPELREGYEVVKGDVTQDPDALKDAVKDCDYVFHVAGLIKGRKQTEFNAVNAHGTRNLCEAVKRAELNPKRFVLCSSLAAIGPCEDSRDVITEDRTPHPVTFYGRSKLLGEKFARQYMDDFPITIIRPPAVYGPRDTGILEFFQFMAKGYSLQLGNKEKVFSMVHGKDVALGLMQSALHEAAAGETFFVTNPEPYPMSWTMELLREILKPSRNKTLKAPEWVARAYARVNDLIQVITRKPMLPNSDKMRELLPPYWVCSGEKAQRVFAYKPKIDVREGMHETAEWYKKEGWIKVK